MPVYDGNYYGKVNNTKVMWDKLRLSPRAGYIVRTLLAMSIALFTALFLQLPTPASAAVTVMIIANPSRGGIVLKGLWRICGTVTGAIAAIIIVASFPQQPLLFLTAFSLWLGVCTFASGMLRHFRAYAAVLSGYTVAIICVSATSDPGDILSFALSRLAVVTVGVATSTIVAMVFQSDLTGGTLREGGWAALRDTARLMLGQINGVDGAILKAERSRLAITIDRLDETVEFAGAEAPDIARHSASLRRGFAALYGALMSAAITKTAFAALSDLTTDIKAEKQSNLRSLAQRLSNILQNIASSEPVDNYATLMIINEIASVLEEVSALQTIATSVAEAVALMHIHQWLDQLHDALMPIAAWSAGRQPHHTGPRLVSFKDYASAFRNGVRTMVAVMLGGLSWYITAWSTGSSILITLGATCALVSTAPSAAAASIAFLKGAVLATLAAFCVFMMLSHVSGFPLLLFCLMPFLVLGIAGSSIPRFAPMSIGFVIFFITQLNIADIMRYDIVSFLNSGIVFVIGPLAAVFVFRVLLPPSPLRDARYLTGRLRRASERFIKGSRWHPAPDDDLGWLVVQKQGFQRLFMRLQSQPEVCSLAIDGSGALLFIAREGLRLRLMLTKLDLPAVETAAVQTAIKNLGMLRHPRSAARAALRASNCLVALHGTSQSPGEVLLRIAAGFRLIAAVMPEAENLLAIEGRCGIDPGVERGKG